MRATLKVIEMKRDVFVDKDRCKVTACRMSCLFAAVELAGFTKPAPR